jgi:hypothetical protein
MVIMFELYCVMVIHVCDVLIHLYMMLIPSFTIDEFLSLLLLLKYSCTIILIVCLTLKW